MIVRNDDVAADASLSHLEAFCAVCDRAGVRILHAITVSGRCLPVDRVMTNSEILSIVRGVQFSDRQDLIAFLRSRKDLIAVHGLYHTHEPSLPEIRLAASILEGLGLAASYFVPPFNEGEYGEEIFGLRVSAGEACQIENAIANGKPLPKDSEIGYLHSWRFDPECSRIFINRKARRQLTLADLESVLQ